MDYCGYEGMERRGAGPSWSCCGGRVVAREGQYVGDDAGGREIQRLQHEHTIVNDNTTASAPIAEIVETVAAEMTHGDAWITNRAAVLGIPLVILAVIFRTSSSDSPRWKKFYGIVPSILAVLFHTRCPWNFGIIDPGGDLYYVASRFLLLPTCLVLLCLAIDLPGIFRLGPKLLIIFFTATAGIILGTGPIRDLGRQPFPPDVVGGEGAEATWRGLSTVAGSWIGGVANMAAMKEIFLPSEKLFAAMITVDVIVANIWMGFMLWMAGRSAPCSIDGSRRTVPRLTICRPVDAMYGSKARIPSTADLMTICAVGFAATGIAFVSAEAIGPWFEANAPWSARFSLTSMFFWLIVIATTIGLLLMPLRQLASWNTSGASASPACSCTCWSPSSDSRWT